MSSTTKRNIFQRQKYAQKIREATTFLDENNYHRLPIVYGTDDYFMTEDSLWTGYYTPYKDAGFLNLKTRKEYFNGAKTFFEGFPADKENSGQLLVVNDTQTASEWEDALIKHHATMAESEGRDVPYGLNYYIELSRKAIDRQEFFSKEVYLFVKLGERANTGSGIIGFLQDLGKLFTSGLGIDESQPEAKEKEGALEQVDQLHQDATHWWVNPHPLKRSRVEYISRYLDSLGQPTPDVSPTDRQEWGIGEWQTVMSSFTRNVNLGKGADKKNVYAVEFVTTTGEGRSYAAFLPVAYTPKKVAPSANWLFAASTMEFPVDASLRFEVVAPDRVEKELDKPIQAAKNQEDEERDSGRNPDEVTVENRMELEAASKHSRTQQRPMLFWQCVFAVYDSDEEELKRKVAQLKARFRSFEFRLESPGGGDQRTLFYQSFPGSELLVNDWIQRTNAEFLAASMPWLDVHVGARPENPAFYQGYTVITEGGTAKPGSPVFFDLIDVADVVNRAPVEGVIGDPGGGKALSLSEQVFLADGSVKTVGELEVGDTILDENGKPTTITFITPTMYDHKLYDVTFDDGTVVRADAEHRWYTETRSARVSARRAAKRAAQPKKRARGSDELVAFLERVVQTVDPEDTTTPTEFSREFGGALYAFKLFGKHNLTVAGYYTSPRGGRVYPLFFKREFAQAMLDWCYGNGRDQSHKREYGSVKTTQEILETLYRVDNKETGVRRVNHAIPLANPIQFPERDLPCHPYVLGAWIGDGESSAVNKKTSNWTSEDPEIIEQINLLGGTETLSSRPLKNKSGGNSKRAFVYRISGLNEVIPSQSLIEGRKAIPQEYLTASVEQRLELLRGLMDTDGSVDEKGGCEFYQSDKELAEQVRTLVASLGMKAIIREKQGAYKGADGNRVETKKAYTVAFAPNVQVFRLPRKVERLEPYLDKRRATTEYRYITNIKEVSSEPVRCLTVDSPNHLFLVTNQFIPTHNTVSRGLKPAHENALKGITQFIWDPKGDFTPLKTHATKLLLDDRRIRLINLGSNNAEDSISLDAFAIAEYNPEENIDDRGTTAEEVLRGLTKDINHQNHEVNDVISAVVNAVMREAREKGTDPKMLDVIPILTKWSQRKYGGYSKEVDPISYEVYQKASRQILNRLDKARAHSIARVLFVDPAKGALAVRPGETTIFNALKLKEVEPENNPLESFDIAASRVVSEMMASYIRSLLYRLPDKATKAIFFDEWHVIRRSKSAERLQDWLRRMGRSKRTALTTLSQAAKDLDGGIMNALWVGKAETEESAVASCALLGIEDNDFNIQTILSLGKGEFLFRDHERRVARVKIDFWDEDVLALFNTKASDKE